MFTRSGWRATRMKRLRAVTSKSTDEALPQCKPRCLDHFSLVLFWKSAHVQGQAGL
jgi:hypothetical protein